MEGIKIENIDIRRIGDNEKKEHTVCMAVMLDGHAQHLETVHTDSRLLDPLLAFQNPIHGPRQQANKSVSLRRRQEYLGQLQLQHLTHDIQSCLQL